MSRVYVDPQGTPNPNAVKFNVSVQVVAEGSQSYMSKEAAEDSPLARRIFALDGVSSIFLLGNFVTVNKEDGASWDALVPSIIEIIEEELGAGQ